MSSTAGYMARPACLYSSSRLYAHSMHVKCMFVILTPQLRSSPQIIMSSSLPSASSSVRATPHGFLKIRDEDDGVTMAPRSPTRMRVPGVGSPAVDEEMWKMGESYGENLTQCVVCTVTPCAEAAEQARQTRTNVCCMVT